MTKDEIKAKYLKAPTVEQINEFIKEVGVSFAHFERYYGMRAGLIKNIRNGTADLPVKHWVIFYEKVVPLYGVGFKNEYEKEKRKKVKQPKRKKPAKISQSVLSKLNELNSPDS